MKGISRVLVANRGEIAVRVIRACRDLGFESVVTVSRADEDSMPAKMAHRAVCVGPPSPTESYLRVDTIVAAALGTGCDAVHPGYGFLAEQPELAARCAQNGLIFVGPTADNIKKMGDKLLARKMAESQEIAVIPGSELVSGPEEAVATAERVGYPLLLKAAAGGGGKGMKIVDYPRDLKTVFQEASAEALGAFGDDRLYIEHFIRNARHIEIQIIGDRFGNVVHLFERDCSLQRRYQKMVEEAPCPVMSAELRDAMCRAAVKIARHIRYENAGTVEFILDQDRGRFYFLEMNTRIQVEHPVTEMITGLDLVKEQFQVAGGESFSFSQEEVIPKGHAIECRINAESPKMNFTPYPGRITAWRQPEAAGVRVDTHCYSGYFVPPYYDSLLAKLVTWGDDRKAAIERMQKALADFVVSGVETTIPFHRFILESPGFRNGDVNTRWLEDRLLKEYERNERN